MKYILKKDLPYVKAGTEFIEIPTMFNSGGNVKMYCSFSSPMIHSFSEKDIIELKDWFEPITEKPPLGLTPLWLHQEQRLKEIEEAIDRYREVGKDIPQEWLDEKEWLQKKSDERDSHNKLSDTLDKIIPTGVFIDIDNLGEVVNELQQIEKDYGHSAFLLMTKLYEKISGNEMAVEYLKQAAIQCEVFDLAAILRAYQKAYKSNK